MSYRFFGTLINDTLTLDSDDVFHLTKVLRIQKSEELEIVVGDKLYIASVASFTPFSLEVKEVLALSMETLPVITLYYSLPKGDKLELVLQKSVELGVHTIVLMETARSVTKIKENKVNAKKERYQKIVKSAAMQSKRNYIPEVLGPLSFNEALKTDFALKLIAHEKATLPFAKVLSTLKETPKDLSMMVGPEGGFSEEEVKKAIASGYYSISFGPTILRSETAPLYALSVINYYKEGLKL